MFVTVVNSYMQTCASVYSTISLNNNYYCSYYSFIHLFVLTIEVRNIIDHTGLNISQLL